MKTSKQILKLLNRERNEIATSRDNLRDLHSEIEELEEISERALASLDEAVEALSELV